MAERHCCENDIIGCVIGHERKIDSNIWHIPLRGGCGRKLRQNFALFRPAKIMSCNVIWNLRPAQICFSSFSHLWETDTQSLKLPPAKTGWKIGWIINSALHRPIVLKYGGLVTLSAIIDLVKDENDWRVRRTQVAVQLIITFSGV